MVMDSDCSLYCQEDLQNSSPAALCPSLQIKLINANYYYEFKIISLLVNIQGKKNIAFSPNSQLLPRDNK